MKRRQFVGGLAAATGLAACAQQESDCVAGTEQSARSFEWSIVTSWPPKYPGLGIGVDNLAGYIAAASGGIIGTALCLWLLDGIAVRFSMGAFGLILDGPTIMLGLLAGLLLGFVGSLPPTLRCLRMPITQSLKAM